MDKNSFRNFDQFRVLRYFIRWFLYVLPVSIVVGSLIALFLWLLEKATELRFANEWLLYLLPVIGVVIVAAYKFKGKNSEAGNNLVMDEIHKRGCRLPSRTGRAILLGF